MLEQDRVSVEPLIVGIAIAVLLHALALPVMVLLRREPMASDLGRAQPAPKMDWIQPAQPKIEIGRDDAPRRATVAWIPHDAFEELIAPKAETLQPVLQTKVDPVEQAKIVPDPTPPAPQPQPMVDQTLLPPPVAEAVAPEAQPKQPEAVEMEQKPQPSQPPTISVIPAPPSEKPDMPPAQEQVEPVEPKPPVEVTQPKPVETKPEPQPQETRPQPQPANPATMAGNPTAAPRSEAESPPTTIDGQTFKVKPGKVLVSKGIEINTAIPDIGTVTAVSVWPANPKAKLEFGPDGKVVRATLVRSTGYPGYDTPIVASLYRWNAKGEMLQLRNRPFVIYVDLLLNK